MENSIETFNREDVGGNFTKNVMKRGQEREKKINFWISSKSLRQFVELKTSQLCYVTAFIDRKTNKLSQRAQKAPFQQNCKR